jgi:hypothetical protein
MSETASFLRVTFAWPSRAFALGTLLLVATIFLAAPLAHAQS